MAPTSTASQSLRATVGQIPFNFQIGADAQKIPLPKPATPDGELEVRLDNCDGPPVATASLTPARVQLRAHAAAADRAAGQAGKHDLCFSFTRSRIDPMWVIGSLELAGN